MQERKRLQDMERYKQNYFLLFKRRILKQLRDEKNKEADQIIVDRRRQTEWTKYALVMVIIKDVYRAFERRKELVRRIKLENSSATRIGRSVRRHMRARVNKQILMQGIADRLK